MIRLATPQDAAAICHIWNHYIRETTVTFLPDEKSVAEVTALIETQPVFVWDAQPGDGGIAGFARYFQFRGGRGYAHTVEHTVLLSPDHAGQGIGRALIEALCNHARGAGMHSIWAGVSGENIAAVAFHASCGFEEVARLPEVGYKFGRWIDLVLMQRRLGCQNSGATLA